MLSASILAMVVGCTDWDAGSGVEQASPSFGPGVSSVGRRLIDAAAAIVYVDGWQPGAVDGGPVAPAGDVGLSFDGGAAQTDAGNATADGAVAPDSGPLSDTSAPFDSVVAVDSATQDDMAAPLDTTGASDVTQPDVAVADVGAADVGAADVGAADVGAADVGVADVGAIDVGVADVGAIDVGVADVEIADVAVADVADGAVADVADGVVADGVVADVADGAAADAGATDTWPTWTPDWGGYADVTFADGVDIYGGVITSCFNLYTYAVTESCAYPDLNGSCIDNAAKDGSVYSQYLFAPLQGCMKSQCVPKCKNDKDPKCVEACLGKYCATPFFACLSQGEKGSNGCPATFACLSSYEDKLFSIATKCFGNATVKAQVQLANFFACGAAPQTEGCIDLIASCYGAPGTLDCVAVIQCVDKTCAKGDEVCGFQCIGKGTDSAVSKLGSIWDCSLAKCNDCNGPNGCGDPCTNKLCKAEQLACLAD